MPPSSSSSDTISNESKLIFFAFANTVWYMLTAYQYQKATVKKVISSSTTSSSSSSSSSDKKKRDGPTNITKSTELHVPSPPPSSSSPSSSIMTKELKDSIIKGREIDGFAISSIRLHDIPTLRDQFSSANNSISSSFSYNKVLGKEDIIIGDIVRSPNGKKDTEAYVRAGPRSQTHFDPSKVRAAIVTCGGLCPGLNNVIRDLVTSLYHLYNVDKVYGIRGGFHGFKETEDGYHHIDLSLDVVADAHHQGGTILASSRGGFDIEVIIDYLKKYDICQLYVIGGDGTHRGAYLISQEAIKRKLNISVVGIPKTIDNDVDVIDRSFGFTTSVEAAQAAIISAKTEARCNLPNGIGIVKLMGRSSGFIASHATLASGDVDLCLVPEVPIQLEGEHGCLPFLRQRVKDQGHAVVVVAEGAGEDLLGQSTETDASGNRKLPPIGDFLKSKINEYFKSFKEEATVKYIDPSYMIRSVPANASDSLLCMLLAQNAVHGAMAGYTAFSIGLVNNRIVMIPITRLVATSPRVMDPNGRTWERILSMTRQPNPKPIKDYSKYSINDRTMC